LSGEWVSPDVRDEIVETMLEYKHRTGIPMRRLLKYLGLKESKYYEWRRRYGIPNLLNGKVPKASWLFEHGRRLVIEYAMNNREEGSRCTG